MSDDDAEFEMCEEAPKEETEEESTTRAIREAADLMGEDAKNLGRQGYCDANGNPVRRCTRRRVKPERYVEKYGFLKPGSEDSKTFFEDDLNSDVFAADEDDTEEEEEEEEEDDPNTDDDEAIVRDDDESDEDDEYNPSEESDEEEDDEYEEDEEEDEEEEEKRPAKKKPKRA